MKLKHVLALQYDFDLYYLKQIFMKNKLTVLLQALLSRLSLEWCANILWQLFLHSETLMLYLLLKKHVTAEFINVWSCVKYFLKFLIKPKITWRLTWIRWIPRYYETLYKKTLVICSCQILFIDKKSLHFREK